MLPEKHELQAYCLQKRDHTYVGSQVGVSPHAGEYNICRNEYLTLRGQTEQGPWLHFKMELGWGGERF